MIQLQIIIDTPKHILINILKREDATADEFRIAKAIEKTNLNILKSAGMDVLWQIGGEE